MPRRFVTSQQTSGHLLGTAAIWFCVALMLVAESMLMKFPWILIPAGMATLNVILSLIRFWNARAEGMTRRF